MLIIISSTQGGGQSGEASSLKVLYQFQYERYTLFRNVTGHALYGENFTLRQQNFIATEVLIMVWVLGEFFPLNHRNVHEAEVKGGKRYILFCPVLYHYLVDSLVGEALEWPIEVPGFDSGVGDMLLGSNII